MKITYKLLNYLHVNVFSVTANGGHIDHKNKYYTFIIPYYRKLTLHEIKVLEINAT